MVMERMERMERIFPKTFLIVALRQKFSKFVFYPFHLFWS